MLSRMTRSGPADARAGLLQAGIELFRRKGYVAATVDDVCQAAGVTKGAFFHHFASKEALAEACLTAWGCHAAGMMEAAPFQRAADPLDRLVGAMDFTIALFANPDVLKSCLAGTLVQEVAETHPALRAGAQACFGGSQAQFQTLLDAACARRRVRLDTAALARLWSATMQGALILHKASGDETVIPQSLTHVRDYIRSLVGDRKKR